MKKVLCLLLSVSIMFSFSSGAFADDTLPAPLTPGEGIQEEAEIPPQEDILPEEPGIPDMEAPADPLPEEPREDIPVEEDGEEIAEPQPEEPAAPAPVEGSFSISSVTASSTPDPLTVEGGSLVFTITGTHLEQEQVWIRVDKDNTPYQIVRASEYTGFLETLKNNLLSFLGQNVTQLSTPAVTLEPGSADAYSVYTASVLHSADAEEPSIADSGWTPVDGGFIVPKSGSDPEPSEEALPPAQPTVGESAVPGGSTPSGGDEPAPNDPQPPVTDPSETDPAEPVLPEDFPAVEPGTPEGPSAGEEAPDLSDVPETPAEPEPQEEPVIRGASVLLTPETLTATGGMANVVVRGEHLDKTTVWVRIVSPEGKSSMVKASGSADEVYSERITIGENLTGVPAEYALFVAEQASGRPAADSGSWRQIDSIVVPPVASDDSAASGGNFEISAVHVSTLPTPFTYQGGAVTVIVEGSALDTQKLFVKLDNGGKEPIIKKLVSSGSGIAASPEIKIPANDSSTRDITYAVSLLAQEDSFTPSARAGGWKRYADFTVPMVPVSQTPSIDSVEWEDAAGSGSPAIVFRVKGENLDKPGNSVWVKAVPKTDSMGVRTKILRASELSADGSVSTEPLATKLRGEEAGKARFDVYAMAKTDEKKPDENDKNWKRYSQSAALTQNAAPHITRAGTETEFLPSEGGRVRIDVEGEFLDGLAEGDCFVRMERIEGDGEPYRVDHNVTGGAATFLLPANVSQTKNQVYQYSTYLKSKAQVWGTITVSRGIAVSVETFGPDGSAAPLTAAGGSLRCTVSGVPEGEHVWIRVSDGTEQVGLSTDTFTVRENDSPVREREVRVYMAMGGVKPGAGSKAWEQVKFFTLPALNAGKPEAVIDAAQVEAEVSAEGGEIRVRYEGMGLSSTGLAVFTRLASADPAEYPDVISAVRGSFPETVTGTVQVPANDSALTRQYTLQYTLCYVDGDTPPAGAVWQSAAIPEGSRLVTVPGMAAPSIASVEVQADADPLSATGGEVDVAVRGMGLEDVWVNVRCPADPMRDLMAKGVRDENGVTAHFDIEPYSGSAQLGYEVWVLAGGGEDPSRAVTLPGWKLYGAFSQSPVLGAPKLTNLRVEMPASYEDGVGTATLSVTGLNMKNRSVWAAVTPLDGGQEEQAFEVRRVSGSTDQYTASFPVQENMTGDVQRLAVALAHFDPGKGPKGEVVPVSAPTPVVSTAVRAVDGIPTRSLSSRIASAFYASGGESTVDTVRENASVSTVAFVQTRAAGNTPADVLRTDLTLGMSGIINEKATITIPSQGGDVSAQIKVTLGATSQPVEVLAYLDDDNKHTQEATPSSQNDYMNSLSHIYTTQFHFDANKTKENKVYYIYLIVNGIDAKDDSLRSTYGTVTVAADETEIRKSGLLYDGTTAEKELVLSYKGPMPLNLYKAGGLTGEELANNYEIRAVAEDGSTIGSTPALSAIDAGRENFKTGDFRVADPYIGYPYKLVVARRGASGESDQSYDLLTRDLKPVYMRMDIGRDPNETSSPSSSDDSSDDDSSKDDDDSSSDNSGSNGSISGGDGISGDDLINADKNTDTDSKDVIIDILDDEVVLSRDFLEEADNFDKNIILRTSRYEWKIPRRSDMRSNLKKKYDLTVIFGSEYEDEMQEEAGNRAEILPFHIRYEGNLPTRMVLTIFDTGYERGTDVWVHRYNEDDDDCTLIAEEIVKSGGDVSWYMTHCSHYFISDIRVRNARLDRDFDSAWDEDDDRIDKVYLDDDFYDDEYSDGDGKVNPRTGTLPA